MGSSEKTVKQATCFRRSCPSPPVCWRSAWQLLRNTICQYCSSSVTQLTMLPCLEELISRKPSLQELSRDSATTTTLLPVMMDKRIEMEDLTTVVMMVVLPMPPLQPPQPHPPPPMLPPQSTSPTSTNTPMCPPCIPGSMPSRTTTPTTTSGPRRTGTDT